MVNEVENNNTESNKVEGLPHEVVKHFHDDSALKKDDNEKKVAKPQQNKPYVWASLTKHYSGR